MKKFITLIVVFALPFLVLFLLNEYYCRNMTTFAVKKDYLEKNCNAIEVLILGSSHSQNGINPEFLNKKSCNLAFGSQAISMDYFLLDKYIDKMPKLKIVLMEVSPFRFYGDHDITKFNGYIYSNIYKINYKQSSLSLKNYSLVLSNYKYFTSIFYDYLNPYSYKYFVNAQGFVTNDFNDRFDKLKYDSIKINQSFSMEHSFENKELFRMNDLFMKKLIRKCNAKKVKVILLSTPVYKTYQNKIPVNAIMEVDSLLHKYQIEFGVKSIDFSENKDFNIYDYKNDNHLNSNGAKKLTKKIDSLLLQ